MHDSRHKFSAMAFVATLVLVLPVCGNGNKDNRTSDRSSRTTAPNVDSAKNGPIAFVHKLRDEGDGAVFISDVDGKNQRQITQVDATLFDDFPDWAPDASALAFTRCGSVCQIWTVAPDGSSLKTLSPSCSETGDIHVCSNDGDGTYSPDGQSIAFDRAGGGVKYYTPPCKEVPGEEGPDVFDQIEKSQIYVMDADGRHPRAVTSFAGFSGDTGGPRWSPDGKQLVFTRMNSCATEPARGRALFIVNSDGTGLRQLTSWSLGAGGHDNPDWSPVTNLILFRAVADEEAGVGNFFTIHPDGTSLLQVTHFKNATVSHKASFSPDGHWIVFAKAQQGTPSDLYEITTEGTGLRRITTTTGKSDTSPDWGPAR